MTDTAESLLKELVDMYVANQGTDSEFIKCITPQGAYSLTAEERKKDIHWNLWDRARACLKEKR